MHPAIFLDRDGVIIENRANYVRSWEDVLIFPQAVRALSQLRTSSYRMVLVTNQSAVGRGLMTLTEVDAINQRLVAALAAAGCRMDGVFVCPHAPEAQCDCRKPRPGLIYQAERALQLDLKRSILIGDAWSDALAGQAAGIQHLALVKTGRGLDQVSLPKPASLGRVGVYSDLSEALEALVRSIRG